TGKHLSARADEDSGRERGCESVHGEAKTDLAAPLSMKQAMKNVFAAAVLVLVCLSPALAQTNPKPGSHSTRVRPSMSAEAKALLEDAIGVVCTQAKLDPRSSIAIDEMQARPSLPITSPDARAGAERAQRLLPIAKSLVINSMRQLTT